MLMIWRVLAMAVELCISSLPYSIMLVIGSGVLDTCVTSQAKGTVIMKKSEKSSSSLLIAPSAFTAIRYCFAFVVRIVIHCCAFSNTAAIHSVFNLMMAAVFKACICYWVDCVIHLKLKGFYHVMLLFCWQFHAFVDLPCDCIQGEFVTASRESIEKLSICVKLSTLVYHKNS